MQQELLKLAQNVFGPKDPYKTVFQPTFVEDGPHIRNTPNLDGAFAELSRNAEGYWPTAIYELAHETVHLLNPKPGVGNWLSEGMAVAFSLYAQQQYGIEPQAISMPAYRCALALVSELSPNTLASGRRIREVCGSFDNATIEDLRTLFPDVECATLIWLCQQFQRDWQDGL
ncbi:MAG: hypothetical protein F4Y61_01675 [Rhodothermaceae bacterium]|nr:hypothetical protein [Rhodothermaceae bacterium]